MKLLLTHLVALVLGTAPTAKSIAEDRPNAPAVPRDVLALTATVTTAVQPDLTFVVLAVERAGPDAAPLSSEVNQLMARGLANAKATAGVQASTGNYSTNARFDNRGQRNGWQVRAELILKAKEFGVLGTLAGKLSRDFMIVSNGFEISPDLRARSEVALIERGIAEFRSKAQTATKAFGNASYSVREVRVGQIDGGVPPQPQMDMMMRGKSTDASAPMQVEAGDRQMSLSVSGSIQMQK